MYTALDILVVDDDQDNAASLGELFELEGHRVRVVHSGEEAINAYMVRSFDVAFMDVMMPGKNGVESFLEIRKMKPQARVFMMTGYSVEELLQQAVTNGALGVLEKPFDAHEVLRLTESVGPRGLVVAASIGPQLNVGAAIHGALQQAGKRSILVRDQAVLEHVKHGDDVLVLDTQVALIDAVSSYKEVELAGHAAPTILVPKLQTTVGTATPLLSDVGITGILNKPFDPLNLLIRLPQLAA